MAASVRHLVRPAIWLSVATIAGQVLALAVQLLIASLFGAGRQMDAYLAASTLPIYVNAVAVGGLGFVLVPMYAGYRERGDDRGAWALAGNVSGVLAVGLGALAVAGILAARPLLLLVVPGLEPETLDLATRVSRFLWPTVLFGGMVALWTGLFQARQQFTWPAIVPLIGSLLMIALLVGWARGFDIRFLAAAVAVTGGVQAALLLGKLRGQLRFRFALGDPDLRQMAGLLGPLVVGSGFGQAARLVDRFVASHLPVGSISYLGYGDKIASLASAALAGGIAVVLFPVMARHSALDARDELSRSVGLGLRMSWLVVVPAICLGIALAPAFVATLLQRGAFTAADTGGVVRVLPGYLLALAGMALGNVTARAFYALKDTKTLSYIAVAELLAYAVYTPWLARRLGTVGVACAVAFYWNLSLALQLVILRRRLGPMAVGDPARAMLKMTGAAVGAALIGYAVRSFIASNWVALLVGGVAGLAVYGGGLWILHVEEWRALVQAARIWPRRLRAATQGEGVGT